MKKMMVPYGLLLFISLWTPSLSHSANPKYGPSAERLYLSHEYLKKNAAPDFWALMPYYVPQENGRSCSVASSVMVLNALKAKKNLSASEKLITHSELIKKSRLTPWRAAVGPFGSGVTLDELKKKLEYALEIYEVKNTAVEATHMDDPQAIAHLKMALIENEKSDSDFIILNFLQSDFTGDPEGKVGHLSPLAAWNSEEKKALIFDTDREWYEPYWISLDTLIKGMSTLDQTAKKQRGFLWIRQKPN